MSETGPHEDASQAPGITSDETPEDKAVARLSDRRGAQGKPREIVLTQDRLEVIEQGRIVHRLALSDVKSVRLSVDMAGSETQVVARVRSKASEIVFGSRAYAGPGLWTNNAAGYRRMLLEIHRALAPRKTQIRFVEGHTLGLRVAIFGLGGAMALAGVLFAWYMTEVRQSTMLAFAALPFVVIGGYLAWVFRPGVPLPYNPDDLVARFEKSEADAAEKPEEI